MTSLSSTLFPLSTGTVLKFAWAHKAPVLVLLLVAVLAVVSRYTAGLGTRYSAGTVRAAKSLLRSANEWHASAKDGQNPLLGLVNNSMAIAYLRSAHTLVDAADVPRVCPGAARLMERLEAQREELLKRVEAADGMRTAAGELRGTLVTGWVHESEGPEAEDA